MPRVKAPSAPVPGPADSLANVTIAFAQVKTADINANHPGLTGVNFAQIKSMIGDCQGAFTSKVSQCTHLVATSEQYDKQLARVKEASKKSDIKIVSYDWFNDSLESQTKVDETPYLLNASNYIAVPNTPTVNGKSKSNQKRSRETDSDDQKQQAGKKKKTTKDGVADSQQSTKLDLNGSFHVPVDEQCPNSHNYSVYRDDDGVIFDVTLNQTNAGNNNNKYYRIQLLKDTTESFWCWTKWGRVGDRGQTKMLGDGGLELAQREFEKKFKEKNGNTWDQRDLPAKSGKYTLVEINYEESSEDEDAKVSKDEKAQASTESFPQEEDTEEPKSDLPEPVIRLLNLIFNNDYFQNTLSDLDYDANKMPLGKLSKKTLLKGYEVLKELAALIADPTLANGVPVRQAVEDLSNRYLSLIPHDFRHRRPVVLSSMKPIKREIDLLENLTDMQLANEIMKHAKSKQLEETKKISLVDRQYNRLGMQEMTPLDPESTEFQELADYLMKSSGNTHNIRYKVQDIFRIERNGEDDRFKTSKYSSLKDKSDRRLLWHGSRCTNFGGILSQGLRIAPPEAPVSGYAFGKGIYLADMSTKSANYCCSYNSGGTGLLLLCEAELGKPPLELTISDSNAGDRAKDNNSFTTFGLGATAPQGWKDAGCVHESLAGVMMPDVSIPPGPTNIPGTILLYNEYICYDVSQLKLRYLFRAEM